MNSPIPAASSSIAGSADERTGFSDDEMDWEEIEVPNGNQEQGITIQGAFKAEREAGPSTVGPTMTTLASGTGHIEITIKRGKTVDEARKYVKVLLAQASQSHGRLESRQN